MSGRLVSAVFDSALPAWLKPYAAAFASFAADDGSRVYPTQLRIAQMVGRSERATRTAVQELQRRRVLVLVAPPGRGRGTRYVFNQIGLPQTSDGVQLPLLLVFSRFPQAKRSKHSRNGQLPQFPQPLTGSGRHHDRKWASGDPSDPSISTSTRARARRTGTEGL